jgi:putative transposase
MSASESLILTVYRLYVMCLAVGVRVVADKIWLVSFLGFDLGFFDEVAARVEPGANAFASKVLTMSPV